MKLTGTYRIPAPRDRVFTALVDPAVLQRCIEGAEHLVRTAEGEYDMRLKIGIAALKGSYVGKARLSDAHPPDRLTLHLEGQGTPGFVRGRAHIRLSDGPDTEATCEAEGQVGGLIAAVGSRLLEAAARRLMDRFFERLSAEMQA